MDDLLTDTVIAPEASAVARCAARLDELRRRLDVASAHEVTVVAVTKGFDAEVAATALAAGAVDLGENYADELIAKAAQIAGAPFPGVRWHFIGRLQRNKIRRLAPVVGLWQSVDRLELVERLATDVPGARILVQVNAADEVGKGGCSLADAPRVAEAAAASGLRVEGLMTVGVAGDERATRAAFAAVRALTDRLGLGTCSMGMSDDLHLAVEEGTTMVRVGRTLFGSRPPR